jgi:hypothetical protein
VTHFFLERDGRSPTPLHRHNYKLCGGKVRVIGCMMIDE